jgi:integrase
VQRGRCIVGSIQRVDRPKPWLARYRGPDGRQHSKAFRRKVDAQQWLRGEESTADRAEWVDPRGGSVLFTEWAETWLAGLHELKPKTLDGYSWHLSARVLPTFGDRRLRAITPAMVREWQNRLLGDGLSPGTVRQSRQVLSLILGQAVNDGMLVRNPCEKVKPPTVRPRRQLFLAADHLEALAAECGDYGSLVWFLGWSGLRLGEAVALRVGRVDPERRRVRVEESATEVNGRLVFGTPKTHEARTVVVPRFVMDRLESLLDGKGSDELVFTSPRGGPLRANNFRRRVFTPAAERIGVPDLVIHDLRDTAASLAISAGASIKAVQRMLGHASAAMTLDTYGSLFEDDLDALADRLEARYG